MKPLVIAALLLASQSAFAGDAKWQRFRGHEGAGVADDEKPPVEFGPDKNVLWQVATPSGPSSPCIWNDRIFLTAYDGGKLWTLCLDRATGKELWRRDAGAEKIEEFLVNQGSPAAATPATDGERVVVYFGSCGLIAYDFAGKELWRHALPCAETNNDFGSGTSPLLADGLVVLVRDVKADSAVLALDAATGKPVWRTARPDMFTGCSTPMIWEHDGVNELIAPGGLAMKAYDLRTGTERWLVRELSAVNCTSPVTGGGLLYLAGWSPAGEDAPMAACSFRNARSRSTFVGGKCNASRRRRNSAAKSSSSPAAIRNRPHMWASLWREFCFETTREDADAVARCEPVGSS